MRILTSLEVGESAILVALDLPPGVQNHLMYMGFVPDSRVKVVRRAPSGDPTVYLVDGIEIALRHETARAIRVQPVRVQLEQASRESAIRDSATREIDELRDTPVARLTEAMR